MNPYSENLFSRVKNLTLVTSRLVEGLFSGNYRSVFKGPGLEFDEVREYVDGDDARIIDWNVSSRMATPYIKTFKEEREIVLFLLIDISASLESGTGEFSKRQMGNILAALLAFSAVFNSDRVGACFFSDRIEKWISPQKGQKHVNRLLYEMLHMKPVGVGSNLGLGIKTVLESLKRRGICIIISDFKTSPAWSELTHLAKNHDVIAIQLIDPADRYFPQAGLVELQDMETSKTILAYGHSRKFRRQYHDYWDMHLLYWAGECKRRGIGNLTVCTTDDPVEKLLGYFKRRRKH